MPGDATQSVDVTVLAAVDRRLAIGRDNDLPWRLPDDLARFKARTIGKALLMGRRTAESLGRALPGRRNLVLTRSGRVPFAGMEAVASFEDALAIVAGEAEGGRGELCVIGGAEVYALALPHASSLRLTRVDTVVADADAFFPAFDEAGWRVISRERHPADGRHAFAFEFVDYRRP